MATLQIRDLPEDLYLRLKERAVARHRSLAQEATAILERAVAAGPRSRRESALLEAKEKPVPLPSGSAPAAKLIREDRER